ncbi:MAG TPA: DUF2243 domain-containing protein, partial [Saliniramus sp.]|nr:DUF2243 domain-containing protein [Saliniramus sp.]
AELSGLERWVSAAVLFANARRMAGDGAPGGIMAHAMITDERRFARRLAFGGVSLGFALGGFFDGIVLHQILQWHHLLSNVAPTNTIGDLRFQVLADGMFHAAHYAFAMLGLYLIWSARRCVGGPGSGRRLIAFSLIGFGAWHIVDAVLVHWILQLHRIRMDVDHPLLWDIAWLVPFGIVPAWLGYRLLQRIPPADASGQGGARLASILLAGAVLAAGTLAAVPPTRAGEMADDMSLVVFRSGRDMAGLVAALDAVDGRIVWTDENAGVWLVAIGEGASATTLYRHGALLVSNGSIAVGCLSWTGI